MKQTSFTGHNNAKTHHELSNYEPSINCNCMTKYSCRQLYIELNYQKAENELCILPVCDKYVKRKLFTWMHPSSNPRRSVNISMIILLPDSIEMV